MGVDRHLRHLRPQRRVQPLVRPVWQKVQPHPRWPPHGCWPRPPPQPQARPRQLQQGLCLWPPRQRLRGWVRT